MPAFWSPLRSLTYSSKILRPVKRDCTVLSRGHFHIKISKSDCINSPVKRFTPVYTCSSFEPHCEEKKAFRINLDSKHTD